MEAPKESATDTEPEVEPEMPEEPMTESLEEPVTEPADEAVLATVNGEEITSDDVKAVQQMVGQAGQQITEEEALEQLINQEVLLRAVEKQGITITNEKVESMLTEKLAAQNLTLEDYKQQVEMQGVQYADHLESLKMQLAAEKYISAAIGNFTISDAEAEELYSQLNQSQELPPFEEAKEQIKAVLIQQKQQQAVQQVVSELRSKAEIEY